VILTALLLACVGLFLSAFFSGSETGFYRAGRLRLALDAMGGDRLARGLVWLTNRPSMFVATTLVGNNLANYITSLAIVMATRWFVAGDVLAAELVAPLLLAPVLFVYGELLPKNLFLHAPNRMLRKGGPLFLLFVVLFFPVSGLLWCINRGLARLLGESPERVRLKLARRELQQVLEEGQQAGILHPAQRRLAQGLFAVASQPVVRYATALADAPRARLDMPKQAVLSLAQRLRLPSVPIEGPGDAQRLIGYVRVIDLALSPSPRLEPIRPLVALSPEETPLEALMKMHTARESLAQVVDREGRTLGVLTALRLQQRLLGGAR